MLYCVSLFAMFCVCCRGRWWNPRRFEGTQINSIQLNPVRPFTHTIHSHTDNCKHHRDTIYTHISLTYTASSCLSNSCSSIVSVMSSSPSPSRFGSVSLDSYQVEISINTWKTEWTKDIKRLGKDASKSVEREGRRKASRMKGGMGSHILCGCGCASEWSLGARADIRNAFACQSSNTRMILYSTYSDVPLDSTRVSDIFSSPTRISIRSTVRRCEICSFKMEWRCTTKCCRQASKLNAEKRKQKLR